MRPYVIWSPAWDHKVGGIRALYALRDELRARGCVAWMHDEVVLDPEAIVVYPEMVQDNRLNAERIVRWRLSPVAVPDDGMVVDWLNYGSANSILTVDLLEPDLFARRYEPRAGTAVIVHKGKANLDIIPADARMITSNNPGTRQEIADLLGSAELLLSFDEFTQVNIEAMLLGTPVLLYPTGGYFTREELSEQGWPQHGVAWTPEQVPLARERTATAWAWYKTEQRRMSASVDRFVIESQARWPSSG